MGVKAPADYIGNMSQLDMVLDARLVLTRDGATPAEWAANSMLINRYSKGAWIAEGTTPARKVGTAPTPAPDYRPAENTRPSGNGNGSASTPAPRRPGDEVTPGQVDLITRLVNNNIPDPAARESILASISTLTKTTVRPVIDALIEMDKTRDRTPATGRKTPAQLDATLPVVPDGRYRLDTRNVKVDNGTGRWAGRIFLVDLDDHGHKMDRITRHADKLALLTEIATDPYAYAVAFGKATGICGSCDTPLEDPESIARGIGPYCEANRSGRKVSEVYRERKLHPLATINQTPDAPAPAAEVTADAPTTPAPSPATPAPSTADSVTLPAPDAVDTMTFPQLMALAKTLKVPGRGTARLPQLREGVKTALTLAA